VERGLAQATQVVPLVVGLLAALGPEILRKLGEKHGKTLDNLLSWSWKSSENGWLGNFLRQRWIIKVAGNTEFDDFLLEGVNLGVTSGQDGGA
jgi:hypothetical protein